MDLHTQKYDLYRTHLTVGGKLMKYPGEARTKKKDLTKAKLLANSTISTLEARFMFCDIKIFLAPSWKLYDYIRLPINIIMEEILTEYNFIAMDKNNIFMMRLEK